MTDEFAGLIPEGDERIRCSSLDTGVDCMRRWAAIHCRRLLGSAGFTITLRLPSIGTHVGSGSHAGIAVSWQGRVNGTDWTSLADAEQAAVETIRTRAKEEGWRPDDTTPSLNDAEHAARKIITVYRQDIGPGRRPIMIEKALAARIKPGWWLTGHLDLFAEVRHRLELYADKIWRHLEDYKTGVRMPAPLGQLGGYDGQLEMVAQPPDTTSMRYIRRVRRSTVQPPPMTFLFDRGVLRRHARMAMNGIIGAVEGFKKLGDPAEFRANPASMLCHPYWCPAFHTRFCPESLVKPKPGKSD